MRNKTSGFTLIELLIVIAIIGILAAVLIPNLLNARARAFDSGAQTCLREIATQMEVIASNSPFAYDASTDYWTTNSSITMAATASGAGFDVAGGGSTTPINACQGVAVAVQSADGTTFEAVAEHVNGTTEYRVRNGTGVIPTSEEPAGTTPALPSLTA